MLPVCPKCDVSLIILRLRSVEVDYCEKCRGVWLDAGEFAEMLEATGARGLNPFPTDAATRPTQCLCPRCDARLEELTMGTDLHLDRCPQAHGIWFDADELERLLRLCPAEAKTAQTIEFLNDMFGKPTVPKEK